LGLPSTSGKKNKKCIIQKFGLAVKFWQKRYKVNYAEVWGANNVWQKKYKVNYAEVWACPQLLETKYKLNYAEVWACR